MWLNQAVALKLYRANTGHRFIIGVTDEAINYLVPIPLDRGISHDIGEAL